MRNLLALLLLGSSWAMASEMEKRIEYNGVVYRTVVAEPKDVQLFWKDETGRPIRQFSALQALLASKGLKPRLLMNGGIFEDGGTPSGLFVSEGREYHPLNLANAPGNFFFKPNGVFYVVGDRAGVVSSEVYAGLSLKPRIAVQSGPLLLRGGKTHPGFKKDSTSYLHRNGVGILKDGRVLFAITEFGQKQYVNFYEFAEFFQSQGCENALFLDGTISQMVTDPKGPVAPGNDFGSIIAITEPAH